jgi:hypothetical protein
MSAEDDNLATLTTAANEFEAQILVNLLDNHGIASCTSGAFTAQFRAEAPGSVRILVNSNDLADARSVVEEVQVPSESAAEDGASPADGSRPKRFVAWTVLIWGLLGLVWVAVSLSTGQGFSVVEVAGLAVSIALEAGAIAALRRR